MYYRSTHLSMFFFICISLIQLKANTLPNRIYVIDNGGYSMLSTVSLNNNNISIDKSVRFLSKPNLIDIKSFDVLLADCDQYFVFNTKNPTGSSIELLENTVINPEAEINPTNITSKTIAVDEDVVIEFDVTQYNINDFFTVGLKSDEGSSKQYNFSFKNNNIVKIFNGTTEQDLTTAVTSPNSKFFIKKVGNVLTFYSGSTTNLVGTITLLNSAALMIYFNATTATNANIGLCLKRGLRVSEGGEALTYYNPKKGIDGSYVKLTDNKLRIKFKQEYNANSTEEKPKVNIIKSDRSMTSVSLSSVKVGTNWKEIDISSLNLPVNNIHTLELVSNKGEKSYLKFLPKDGVLPAPFEVKPVTITNAPSDITVSCYDQVANTPAPQIKDGYTGNTLTPTYRLERAFNNTCTPCNEKLLRIWEGVDSKCYPYKVTQVVTVVDIDKPKFTVSSLPDLTGVVYCSAFDMANVASYFSGTATPTAVDEGSCEAPTVTGPTFEVDYIGCDKIVRGVWTATDKCGNTATLEQKMKVTYESLSFINDADVPSSINNVNLGECYTPDIVIDYSQLCPSCATGNCGVVLPADHPFILSVLNCINDDIIPITKGGCDSKIDMTTEYKVYCGASSNGGQGYYVLRTWTFKSGCGNSLCKWQWIKVNNPTFTQPNTPTDCNYNPGN